MNAVVLIPPAFIAGKLETPIETVGVFLAGYIASTFWLNPDLDIKNSQPTKNWHFFRFIWIPYQSLRHRSIFSHGPIIGTIGRLLYLHVVLLLALGVRARNCRVHA